MENKFIKTPREVYFQLNKLNRYMEGHKGFIAGGVFKNIFNNQKVRDVDIFFKSEEDFEDAKKLFAKDVDYISHYENDNCNAFKNIKTNVVVELVKRRYCEPQELLEIFDFTIVQAAYIKEESEDGSISYMFLRTWRFFEDLLLKKIVIDHEPENISLPANTYERAFKYTKYGFGLCRESKIKLIEALRVMPSNFDISMALYNGID
jgi:hypothetical protein